jgi:hypothetical protein
MFAPEKQGYSRDGHFLDLPRQGVQIEVCLPELVGVLVELIKAIGYHSQYYACTVVVIGI